jgi:hypothetical protein
MNVFKNSSSEPIKNWSEDVLLALLPNKLSPFFKQWSSDYGITIEGMAHKITQEGVERMIYGFINIPTLLVIIPVRISLIVEEEGNKIGVTML